MTPPPRRKIDKELKEIADENEELTMLLTSISNRLLGISLLLRPDHRDTLRAWSKEIEDTLDAQDKKAGRI